MQLHANTKISYYAKVIKLVGARVFDAIPVLSSAECERVRQTVHALRSRWIVRGSADLSCAVNYASGHIATWK